jgi:hypothetical protein
MTILNQGLSKIRDLHYDDADNGILGTDGSAATASQTGLQTEISASEKELVKTKGSQSNQFSYRLDSATATGETYREFATRNADDLAYDRAVFPGVAHTENDEIVIIKTYFYKQG